MIDPIFHYAAGDDWKFPYAPHDVGQYPLANGQVYGYDRKTRVMQDYYQMPVEECGNMILCVAALCKAEKFSEICEKSTKEVLKRLDRLSGKRGLGSGKSALYRRLCRSSGT